MRDFPILALGTTAALPSRFYAAPQYRLPPLRGWNWVEGAGGSRPFPPPFATIPAPIYIILANLCHCYEQKIIGAEYISNVAPFTSRIFIIHSPVSFSFAFFFLPKYFLPFELNKTIVFRECQGLVHSRSRIDFGGSFILLSLWPACLISPSLLRFLSLALSSSLSFFFFHGDGNVNLRENNRKENEFDAPSYYEITRIIDVISDTWNERTKIYLCKKNFPVPSPYPFGLLPSTYIALPPFTSIYIFHHPIRVHPSSPPRSSVSRG